MIKWMLIIHVTGTTKVKTDTVTTFPANSFNGLLFALITSHIRMHNTWKNGQLTAFLNRYNLEIKKTVITQKLSWSTDQFYGDEMICRISGVL